MLDNLQVKDKYKISIEENNTNTTFHTSDKIQNATLENILLALLIAVLFVGVLGNICNLIVFGKKKMRKWSTFRFLLYLSASDLLVLLIAVTDILIKNTIEFEIRSYSIFTCKFHVSKINCFKEVILNR
jgi:hypothetical protein